MFRDLREEESETEEEEYEVEDYYKKVKRFSELTKEEIDIVAGKIRKISPKFEDLFRPEIKGSQEDREYEQEVEKIAARSENVYAVMPQRTELTEQKNISIKEDKKVVKETINNSRKESFHHLTDISSGEGWKSTNQNKRTSKKKAMFGKHGNSSGSASEESEKEEQRIRRNHKRNIARQSEELERSLPAAQILSLIHI